jgi:hypothetical protein
VLKTRFRIPGVSGRKGERLSTIHLHQTTTSTPRQYVAGLDSGPGRSKLFWQQRRRSPKGASTRPLRRRRDGRLRRQLGTLALRLIRSQPRRPHDSDSNLWGGASSHTYTFTRRPGGLTDIDLIVVRKGKDLIGWVLGTIGKGVLRKAIGGFHLMETRSGRDEPGTSWPLFIRTIMAK